MAEMLRTEAVSRSDDIIKGIWVVDNAGNL